MTDTTVLLIRHAESGPVEGMPEPEWPLTAEGKRQSEELAEQLAVIHLDQLVASSYRRAISTLQPLADRLQWRIRIEHDLRERKLSDSLIPDWREQLARSWEDFDHALPGGESARQCQSRVVSAMNRLVERHPGDSLAVCSHGNAISLFIHHFDAGFGFKDWQTMGNPHLFRVRKTGRGWERLE